MTIFEARIVALGCAGAGLGTWTGLREALQSDSWRPDPQDTGTPACLPSRAARRLSPAIRLALSAAEEVGPALPGTAPWVFASSVGEGETLNEILRSLLAPEMLVQPLRFQNAVHNAASGQWTIAKGLRGAVTSIAGHDHTAGAGLLKALMQVRLEETPVGVVIYDAPLPPPLHEKRPFAASLAVALALAPGGTGPRICAEVGPGTPSDPQHSASRLLAATGNPAAAILPLLEAISAGEPRDLFLGLHGAVGLKLRLETS